MYYHQIDFFTQAAFFMYSFIAGIVAGFFALFLCSAAFKGKTKVVLDIIFCLICVLILVCTNIVFQDAALRVYEVISFLSSLILFVVLFKKKSDILTEKLFRFIQKLIIQPIYRFCKYIINKLKNILKKIGIVVYNFIQKFKEKMKRNAKSNKEKKKKETASQKSTSAS